MKSPENALSLHEEIVQSLKAFAYAIDLQTNNILWSFGNIQSCIGYDPFRFDHEFFEIPQEHMHPQDLFLLYDRKEFLDKKLPGTWKGIFRIKSNDNNLIWIYSQLQIMYNGSIVLKGFYHCGLNDLETPLQVNAMCQHLNGKWNKEKIGLLSNQELNIVKLVAEGHSYMQIAQKLFISPQTVNQHKKNILKKLNFKNTASLVCWATHVGIV